MHELELFLLRRFNAEAITEKEVLQELWSGYGSITRYRMNQGNQKTVIVKSITEHSEQKPKTKNHPRGWDSNRSHQRKLQSYQVEKYWYQQYTKQCPHTCRVANCYTVHIDSSGTTHILLEDLDAAGYHQRQQQLTAEQTLPHLNWLAHFHATFMYQNNSTNLYKGLWPTGTYWHLDTRPDELAAMNDCPLKTHAKAIDHKLSHCNYLTLVHGDAKLANFCYNPDSNQVAAVDFQYVGSGCGMKDVAYFLGSCLNEDECVSQHTYLLDEYFNFLQSALSRNKQLDCDAIEREWRPLFCFAWADFQRFILGWAPEHDKNNNFSQHMAELAINKL